MCLFFANTWSAGNYNSTLPIPTVTALAHGTGGKDPDGERRRHTVPT
jgi:hypothetical protein